MAIESRGNTQRKVAFSPGLGEARAESAPVSGEPAAPAVDRPVCADTAGEYPYEIVISPGAPARERVLKAAYNLFLRHGVVKVGIDEIVEEAGCARASLYTHFGSKQALALAAMELHYDRWVERWLKPGIEQSGDTPEARIMGVLALFDQWFHYRETFLTCFYVRVMFETSPGDPVREAAVHHLSSIGDTVSGLAEEAHFENPDGFARLFQVVMAGSIVAATAGNRNAANEVHGVVSDIVRRWPRRAAS
ncbi:MAG: TetR/AcrR family transcriptional regulator [Pseudomonadota bacterium]